jgi:predicted DNA-binding transcriptional regulator AlpA
MSTFDRPVARGSRCELLTVEELAKILKVSIRTVWRRRKAADVPAPVKIAGAVRWRSRDIERWIKQGCPAGKGGRHVAPCAAR